MDGYPRNLAYSSRGTFVKVLRVGVISINAHFDGEVLVPHEPVDLPRNETLIVRIERLVDPDHEAADSCLNWLSENSVDAPSVPPDLSHQHDHYLYGLPKKDI